MSFETPSSNAHPTREGALPAFKARAWENPIFPSHGPQYLGFSGLDKSELYLAVNRCRQVWQEEVIERSVDHDDYPFVFRVNLSKGEDREHLDAVGRKLARAGRNLFENIFLLGDEGLKEIGRRLDDGLRKRPRTITFHSDVCFVPWGLLYTPPDPNTDLAAAEAPWSMEGFWGYRHVLEQHVWHRRGMSEAITPEEGKLHFGCNVDMGLDEKTYHRGKERRFPTVAPLLRFLDGFPALKIEVRKKKDDLERALRAEDFADDILYFGCHARVIGDFDREDSSPSRLELSDGQLNPITALEIKQWLGTRSTPVARPPVVFLNACQGGQMESRFYRSFALNILAHARCLVGAQIDLPQLFAADYAQRFFRRFFSGKRIGEIHRSLARFYAKQYKNPLGLVYSLYYGLDAHLTEKIPRRPKDPPT